MFAKNRVGFMPGLFVAFLDELTPEEKSDFLQLPSETARAGLVLGHAFIRDKFSNISGLDAKSEAKAARAREEGNREFQAGNFRSTLNVSKYFRRTQKIFVQVCAIALLRGGVSSGPGPRHGAEPGAGQQVSCDWSPAVT